MKIVLENLQNILFQINYYLNHWKVEVSTAFTAIIFWETQKRKKAKRHSNVTIHTHKKTNKYFAHI